MSADNDIAARREIAKARINKLDADTASNYDSREGFFETVYASSGGDTAQVPWADLQVKDKLEQWLEGKSGIDLRAVDVGCGLGDNAEAMAQSGYNTIGFDFSKQAIDWAKQRFENSPVKYEVADLSQLPEHYLQAFDLVHECYTLQSIPPETLAWSIPAVASLVAPGGTLLVYTRSRSDGAQASGPPWPLEESVVMSFENEGLELVNREKFVLQRPDKDIPHWFCEWRRPT